MKFKTLFLITANTLFRDHLAQGNDSVIFFMAEDKNLCTRYRYHKHKIVLLLSAMRSHRDEISGKCKIEYYKLDSGNSAPGYEDKLLKTVRKYRINRIRTYYIENHFFRKRIERFCTDHRLDLDIVDSPGFLTSASLFTDYMDSHKRLHMHDFYVWQRKRLNILVDRNNQPVRGKWSFDSDNRKKLPLNITIPKLPSVDSTRHTRDVSALVNKIFPDHPGNTDHFFLPTTREQAELWMDHFFVSRFQHFGPYQDAISNEHSFNFHSLLSPLINIGLLTPVTVVSNAMQYEGKVPYQSLEGFIRQIIGWREFVRGVYNNVDLKGNFFNNRNRLNDKWYSGSTGITPLDTVIKRVNKYAYANHIERLMVISNLMLLCEILPSDVNRWFTELFVDSSDWVMEPNVYGMGQFSDGGIFATKPYISGSNYILKMSNFKKDKWCDIWDGLYWRFISRNRDFFKSNPRMSLMSYTLDSISKDRKARIFGLADKFIEHVTI